MTAAKTRCCGGGRGSIEERWDLLLTMSIRASSAPVVATPRWRVTRVLPARTQGLVPVSDSCVCAVAPPAARSTRRRLRPPPSPGAYRFDERGSEHLPSEGARNHRERPTLSLERFLLQIAPGLSVLKTPQRIGQSILQLIPPYNTPARDRELIQARVLTHSQLHGPLVVRVHAHKMAATATASCVSAKVRIAPVIRAVDLARVSSRVSRAAACRARDRKPAASWTKRSIWARRASPAVTSH